MFYLFNYVGVECKSCGFVFINVMIVEVFLFVLSSGYIYF